MNQQAGTSQHIYDDTSRSRLDLRYAVSEAGGHYSAGGSEAGLPGGKVVANSVLSHTCGHRGGGGGSEWKALAAQESSGEPYG